MTPMTIRRWTAALLCSWALAIAGLLPAHAQAPAAAAALVSERLTVADPFLEMRTGPGRGYPVFFVVARGQSVVVELRHTDWYKVRAEGGQLGWVSRAQLESTLTAAN